MHASAAIPLIFSPVKHYQRWLVDGGVANPVPVKIAKDLGAEVIIAIDLSALLPETYPTNLFGVAKRSFEITFFLQCKNSIEGADIVIRPQLGEFGIFDTDNLEQVYELGRQATREAIPKILEVLSQKGINAKR